MLDTVRTDYEIVEYRPEFKNQVLSLESVLWGPDPTTNESYFAWKYERNPQADRPILYLALSADRVIGVRGFAGSKWQVGRPGQIFSALLANDFVVSPDYQGKGVAKTLLANSMRDLAGKTDDFVFSFGALASTNSIQNSAGWRHVSPYRPMRHQTPGVAILESIDRRLSSGLSRLPLMWRASRSEFFSALGRKGGLPASAQKYPAGTIVGGHGHVSIEDEVRPAEMAELIQRIGNDGRITRIRDHAFFAWRFQNPRHRYRILFWSDDRLEGYLVLAAEAKAQLGRIYIADWAATREEVAQDLIQAAIGCAQAQTLSIWSTSLPDDEKAILRKFGFRQFDDSRGREGYEPGYSLCALNAEKSYRPFTVAGRDILNPADWNLHMAFTDCGQM